MGTKTRLAKLWENLTESETEREATALQGKVEAAGALPVCNCTDRQIVTVAGTLQTVSISPRGGVQSLEGELWDGSATVTLVWLGRRRIPGIRPGIEMVVTGRIGRVGGIRVMFNPRYEIQPGQHHHGS